MSPSLNKSHRLQRGLGQPGQLLVEGRDGEVAIARHSRARAAEGDVERRIEVAIVPKRESVRIKALGAMLDASELLSARRDAR